jgi:polysaccharide biosynthesis/export protein
MFPIKGEKNLLQLLLVFGVSLSLFSSCVSSKKISYFNYLPDTLNSPMTLQLSQYTDPRIQTNDLLQVSVQTIDPQGASMMGAQQGATYNTQGSQGGATVPGYLVDKNGEIELPLVGRIKLAGLTTSEARNAIAQKASQYYKSPVVNVRFANFNITVLGEVNKPGQYTVPNEKASVLDAIGMAGDLTIFGRRNDILLLREEGNEKKAIKLDLNSKEFFQSPYFYLKQHDVVYVSPTKNRAASADVTTGRTLSFVSLGLTLLTVIITLTR